MNLYWYNMHGEKKSSYQFALQPNWTKLYFATVNGKENNLLQKYT